MRTTPAKLAAAAIFFLAGAIHADTAQDITLHEPWVREMPPVSERSAGYVRIENNGDTERTLVGAESEMFERVELHESTEDDGTTRMVHRETLIIPAGETASLEPGGYHLMLIDRTVEPLRETDGDSVPIHLIFENGDRLEVEAPVLRHGPVDDAGDHDVDH